MTPPEIHEQALRQAAARDDWALAVAAGEAWVAAAPGDAQAHALLGYARERRGDDSGAEAAYASAVRLDPGADAVRLNRAAALARLGRFDDALAQAQAVPDTTDARRLVERLSKTLAQAALAQAQSDPSTAEAALRRAAALRPGDAGIATELGRFLAARGRTREALAAFEAAAAAEPDAAVAWLNLGRARRRAGDLDGAHAAFEAAALADPADPNALAEKLLLMREVADWRASDALEAELCRRIEGGAVLPPFVGFYLDLHPVAALELARRWARRLAVPTPAPKRERRGGGKLRVGYLSEHFRRHATVHLLAETLECHDRAAVEIFAYSYGPDDGSPERARVRAAANSFVDLRDLDDDAAAARIAEDGLDVLVDLMGYVEKNRFGIVCRRPAPAIVSWLGYPGTTGHPAVDWVLADATAIAPGDEAAWSERVWRLPVCYQPNDRKRAVARIPTRAEAGLPASGFVYCCFNHAWKIVPSVFDGWMRVLAAVPESVLWLLDGPAAPNLRLRAEACGIDPARLVFAPALPLADHLARLSLADLALDTRPYGSHTTASDALWVGVPILTAPGAGFASRVAASLAQAAGQTGGIVAPGEFEATAIALAQPGSRLQAMRAALAQARPTAPLFDARAMARALETAYRAMAAPASPRVLPEPRRAARALLFVDPSDLDYRPDTPDAAALGGSQSALCYLARALAARGHRVTTLTGTSAPGQAAGVEALAHCGDVARALAGQRFDAAIVLNDAAPGRALKHALAPGTRVLLWTQHAHDQPAMQALARPEIANAWDGIVAISDWQRCKFVEKFGLDPRRLFVRRNAISPAFENLPLVARTGPARLVYTSTPFRGLTVLLSVFAQARAAFPDTTLDVFSSLAVYQVAPASDPYRALYAAAARMEGVAMRGSLPQPALAAALADCDMLAYPSIFAETGCIAAMEAMAAGLDVVASRLGALPEATLGLGHLAPIDPVVLGDDAFKARYLELLLGALDFRARDPLGWNRRRHAAASAMRAEATWRVRAAEWERLFELNGGADSAIAAP